MNYETRKVMFSSQDGRWRTPQDLFDLLDSEFHFHVDVCADLNHKLRSDLTNWIHEYGLSIPWSNMRCYMNPPYGREITKWVGKAWYEMYANNALTVALLPCRTDTNWFWAYCINQEIRLIKGRVRFLNDDKDELPAPFPS